MQITETFSVETHKICKDYPYWILCPSMGLDNDSWIYGECTSNDPEEQKRLDEEGCYTLIKPTDFTRVTFSFFNEPIKSEDLQAIANRYDGKIILLESDKEHEIVKPGYKDFDPYQGWSAHLRFKSQENMRRALFEVFNLFDLEPDDETFTYGYYLAREDSLTHGSYPDAPYLLNSLVIRELRNLQNLQTEWASY